MKRLKEKVALVTGAASGIGYATAVSMWKEGAKIIALDVNESELGKLKTSLSDRITAICCDVGKSEQVASAVNAGVMEYEGLHIICNCAGIAKAEPFLEMTNENWERTVAVNMSSVYYVCQSGIPYMKQSGGGSIINCGSIASVVAETDLAAYCASKAGVLALTKVIAIEHAKDKIRANCICPGMTDTPMAEPYYEAYGGKAAYMEEITDWQPLGLGRPEQIASIAVFLASEDSGMMTGSAVMADGGFTAM
ncbi:dihydroanticapsin dehydrogenase [Parapedobacter composti]|uniref:Dihydroanticapsin dehydrogenase n=1 Tax=Parapedobacter composti TaxID=623281 RepID=A0A1I1MF07_9SPHI|nr:SDR family NAD(P)-dependent oxidoreductase [Parapedobacter composti]SFC83726.1 dihydroanticapsin dehydrogenase [Parapedobacter composti]